MTLPPIPPSDSLYKFTAIGGLILVVLSLYVPWKMTSDLKIAMLDVELDSRKRGLEIKQLQRALQEIQEPSQEIEHDFTELEKILPESKKSFSPSEIRGFYERNAGAVHRAEQMESKKRELELLLLHSRNMVGKVDLLHSEARKLNFISWLTLSFGVNMMIFGFWNWYFKFQVYQDRIIKGQSDQFSRPNLKNEREEIPG